MSGDQSARARVSAVSSPAARRRRRRGGYVLTPNEGVYAKIPVCRPDEWLAVVERVLTMPSVEALRRRLRVAGPSTVLAAAREWARSADRLTGRDVAVAHATVAAAIGYAAATVKRIMRFLSRLGLIVECARGRSLLSLDELAEARVAGAGSQTSVASTRALTVPRSVDGTPLPPTQPVPKTTHVTKRSPTRARGALKAGATRRPADDESDKAAATQPRWPLEVQRFAGQLVARLPRLLRTSRVSPDRTRVLGTTDAVWSGGQHIGHVCDAVARHRLVERGWTVHQLLEHVDRFRAGMARDVDVDEQRHPLGWLSWLIAKAIAPDEISPAAQLEAERVARRQEAAARAHADAATHARIAAEHDSIEAILAAMHRDFPRRNHAHT